MLGRAPSPLAVSLFSGLPGLPSSSSMHFHGLPGSPAIEWGSLGERSPPTSTLKNPGGFEKPFEGLLKVFQEPSEGFESFSKPFKDPGDLTTAGKVLMRALKGFIRRLRALRSLAL